MTSFCTTTAARPAPEPSVVLADCRPLGIYVHVPFCSSTCDFCAFYQETPARGDFDRYLDGVERELELAAIDEPVATVFWGGGTPGLLPPSALRRLGELLRARLPSPPAEWTVEMTPSSVKEEKLAALREIGVTRISLGAQSFQPRLLEALGRLHPRERIFEAVDKIRRAGFASLNLDLIFSIPGQSLDEWRADLDEATALGPDHLSTYCLTFEEDTALYVKLSQGRVSMDMEKEVSFLREAECRLAAAGYRQYEISNYARPGAECAHNLNTWGMHRWIGIGPAAASQDRGWRGANPAGLDLWLDKLAAGERAGEDRVLLTPDLLAADSLVFGLRMNAGVEVGRVAARFGVLFPDDLERRLREWEGDDLLERDGDRIKLTAGGRLVADRLGAELLEILG